MKYSFVSVCAAVCGVVSVGLAQSDRASTRDTAAWQVTGATSIEHVRGGWRLAPGAQASRSFGADAPTSVALRIEAVLAEDPSDVVAIQVAGATIVLTREGALGVVRVGEGESLAEAPLATFDLSEGGEGLVSVGLDFATGPGKKGLLLSLHGKAVEWERGDIASRPVEVVLSAGAGAPLLITALEVLENQATSEPALNGTRGASANGSTASATVARERDLPESSTPVPAVGTNTSEGGAPSKAERESGAPPGGGGLEVFTPPSVRQHARNEHANLRAKEVKP